MIWVYPIYIYHTITLKKEVIIDVGVDERIIIKLSKAIRWT